MNAARNPFGELLMISGVSDFLIEVEAAHIIFTESGHHVSCATLSGAAAAGIEASDLTFVFRAQQISSGILLAGLDLIGVDHGPTISSLARLQQILPFRVVPFKRAAA